MTEHPKRKIAIKHKTNKNTFLMTEEYMEQLYMVIPSAIFTVDTNRIITSFNRKAEEVTGYSSNEALGQSCAVFAMDTCTKTCNLFTPDVVKPILGKECIIKRKDGEKRILSKNADLIKDADGNVIGGVESFEDITERKKTEEVLNYMAYYDTLTGLPNRTTFTSRLNLALSNAYHTKGMIAVMFLDLDNFKAMNDTLGHTVGDQLLQDVGARLEDCLRESDLVARLGGDEFTVLLTGISSAKDVSGIARNVINALKPPFSFDGRELYVTTSIGASLYPYDGKDSQTLLRNADMALYRAKEQGRNSFQLYTASMNTRITERLNLENRIRKALDDGEFEIYYQPQVDLLSGEIFCMEALLRWHHPGFGTVYPAEFIPVLEEIGLISEIGEWVLRTACKQNKTWQDEGLLPVRIAVNMSPRYFERPNIVERIGRILEETRLNPKYLDIEITENAVIKDTEVIATIFYELREKGIRISIDDFATGYSSLSYLKKFPVDSVKIDQSFVSDLMDNPDDIAIAKAIVSLARNFGLETVAEGVETAEQLEFLRQLGCDGAQGFVFSKPTTAEEAAKLLAQNRLMCA
ncbi:MAG: sensor domain-containing protein [Candidatus Aquicultor sp.]